jgi:hypothetical protein
MNTETDNSKRIEQLHFYFAYLDELRNSGVTNMFGAAPYLAREFAIPLPEARKELALWTKTFGEGDTWARARAAITV